MKILMLGWELPPHNSGGLGVACYNLSKALSSRGVDIDFALPYSTVHENVDFMHIEPTSDLGSFACMNSFGAYNTDTFSKYTDGNVTSIRDIQKKYVNHIGNLVRKTKPDVIHAHDWLTMEAGIYAKNICGAPLVVHVHATEFDRAGTSEKGNPIIHEIEQYGLIMADRIIAVSQITKGIIVEKYNIPADKIEVVHNAIDLNSLPDYEYDRRAYNYLETLRSEGYTVVTALTRFTAQKGLYQLLRGFARACERYDKLVLLLAGDGEQRGELITLSAELGISDHVLFTGFVRGKQWRDTYNVSDIFVMSSVSEPFGLTALEAAHHQSALIISNQSGVSEVLRNTFRYDYWDIDRLADQIIGIANSPALKKSLIQGVNEEYRKLDWLKVADKCLDIYKNVKLEVCYE